MSTSSSWDAALRAELVAAARRQQRRRRQRPRRAAAGTAVLVAVAVTALALRPDEATAEILVERTEDRIVITLLELQEDPHEAEAELRAAGFDVAIELVPAGPSAVGRFVGTTDSGDLPAELVPAPGSGTSFTTFSLPLDWDGALRLHVGRPARPGEAYLGFSDALAPGEPLACLPLPGASAATAATAVAGRAVDVDFRRFDAPSAPPLRPEELRGPFATWPVLRADAIAPGQVIVWLLPPGTSSPMPTPGDAMTCDP